MRRRQTTDMIKPPASYKAGGSFSNRKACSGYHLTTDPFGWMDAEEERLTIAFILSTAYDTYRNWVSFGKQYEPEAAARLVGELTCNGIGKLARY